MNYKTNKDEPEYLKDARRTANLLMYSLLVTLTAFTISAGNLIYKTATGEFDPKSIGIEPFVRNSETRLIETTPKYNLPNDLEIKVESDTTK